MLLFNLSMMIQMFQLKWRSLKAVYAEYVNLQEKPIKVFIYTSNKKLRMNWIYDMTRYNWANDKHIGHKSLNL